MKQSTSHTIHGREVCAKRFALRWAGEQRIWRRSAPTAPRVGHSLELLPIRRSS